MKNTHSRWARRYEAALSKHLQKGPEPSLRPALTLGRQAAALGMEMLDLARIHEQALTATGSTAPRAEAPGRAQRFFAEAATPIEKTHHAARKATDHLSELSKVLGRRTTDLARSHRQLKQGIIRRKGAERALQQSTRHQSTLLEESRLLQAQLRRITRRILLAQESKQRKTSRQLRDDVAQALLGINVRLLVLKKAAATNAEGFEKEIASTQRLVGKSVAVMKQFIREHGKQHET